MLAADGLGRPARNTTNAQMLTLTWLIAPMVLAGKAGLLSDEGKLNPEALHTPPIWLAIASYAVVLAVMPFAQSFGLSARFERYAKNLFSAFSDAAKGSTSQVGAAKEKLVALMRRYGVTQRETQDVVNVTTAAFTKVAGEHRSASKAKLISLAWEEFPMPLWTTIRTRALSAPGNPEQIQFLAISAFAGASLTGLAGFFLNQFLIATIAGFLIGFTLGFREFRTRVAAGRWDQDESRQFERFMVDKLLPPAVRDPVFAGTAVSDPDYGYSVTDLRSWRRAPSQEGARFVIQCPSGATMGVAVAPAKPLTFKEIDDMADRYLRGTGGRLLARAVISIDGKDERTTTYLLGGVITKRYCIMRNGLEVAITAGSYAPEFNPFQNGDEIEMDAIVQSMRFSQPLR